MWERNIDHAAASCTPPPHSWLSRQPFGARTTPNRLSHSSQDASSAASTAPWTTTWYPADLPASTRLPKILSLPSSQSHFLNTYFLTPPLLHLPFRIQVPLFFTLIYKVLPDVTCHIAQHMGFFLFLWICQAYSHLRALTCYFLDLRMLFPWFYLNMLI